MDGWFTTEWVDGRTAVISEYQHWEETHCYLVIGDERALLIDTGLGVGDILTQVRQLTDNPVVAVATHIHWDHIGGHHLFPTFYAHRAEQAWLEGAFPLPIQAVRRMLSENCVLPEDFDLNHYQLFQGHPSRWLADGECIDLGGRRLDVLHTPGHSPGHLCFWEAEQGYLFSGDLAYKGTLFANYPSTDPENYLHSLERVAELPVRRVLPGHHSLDIGPDILPRMRDALRLLERAGKLRHGSGTFTYEDWAIAL